MMSPLGLQEHTMGISYHHVANLAELFLTNYRLTNKHIFWHQATRSH